MEFLLAPESWPFTVAAMLLVALTVVEGLGVLVGISVSGWLDQLLPDPGTDLTGLADAWLGWLHVGKAPILVLLVILLTAFAVIGYSANGLAHAVTGIYLSPALSAPIALLGALPIVRVSGGAIAHLIPRDESTAVSLESLVGRIAVIVNGTARMNFPAEARVKNEHGQTLYVRVEPDHPTEHFGPGESVLLVRQVSGSRFQAIANPHPELL